MKYYVLFSIFLFAKIFDANAQANSTAKISGYIVLNTGDTIRGDFNEQNWNTTPSSISFSDSAGNFRKLTVNDISAFGTSDMEYETWKVDLNISSQENMQIMSTEPSPALKSSILFLKVLVRGSASLYQYTDAESHNHFFIRKSEPSPISLTDHKYLSIVDGKESVVENARYKKELNFHLIDCTGISEQLLNLQYNAGQLTKVIINYNRCKDPNYIIKKLKKIKKFSSELRIHSGVTLHKLTFESTDSYYHGFTLTKFPNSTDPYFGISFNLVPGFFSGNFSLYNEIAYGHYSIKSAEDAINNNSHKWAGNFDHSMLQLYTGVRYQTKGNNLRGYFQAGICNIIIFPKTSTISGPVYFQGISIQWNPLSEDIQRTYEQGLFLGAGLMYKRWGLDFRVARLNGFMDISSLSSKVNTISAGISFSLLKDAGQNSKAKP